MELTDDRAQKGVDFKNKGSKPFRALMVKVNGSLRSSVAVQNLYPKLPPSLTMPDLQNSLIQPRLMVVVACFKRI